MNARWTASMPVREKGRRSPGSQPARPSHVPSHPQTAAKVRGFSPIASGFNMDKRRCRKIQPINKSIDEAHRIVRADIIVNRLRQE